MKLIDADTHVDENEETWSYLLESEQALRPQTMTAPAGAHYDDRMAYWLVDGLQKLRPIRDDVATGTTIEKRELMDVPARLADMDRLRVETQVIYPTFFLSEVTERRETDLALRRSYNRWMAERCALSGGRLRWIAALPMLTMDRALEEMRFARDHGACGLLKKGDREAGYWPADSYFFPLYEEAERLDLPICFHTGSGTAAPLTMFVPAANFYRATLPVVHAFQSLVTLNVPARFPALRWGFIEANSSWLSFVLYNLGHAQSMLRERPGTSRMSVGTELPEVSNDFLVKNRMYVTCQIDEDLAHIVKLAGEDNLLIGSDYTHNDMSQQTELLSGLQRRADSGDLPQSAVHKIAYDNPKRFYAL